MFDAVLVANRGEIAVRVIRTLARLGIRSIAVYSDADADAPHVRLADEAVRLGGPAAADSYLSIERVIAAARRTRAEAIHPGYGFLSESAGFVRACVQAGIVFIGPPAEAMEALGDKVSAKQAAEAAGVPVLPGLHGASLSDEEILAFAQEPGRLPLMVKAAAGGGGRGMRIVAEVEELPGALAAARREALAGFGDDALLVERYVERARHIEVQLLADAHGTALHLGERECSLQRRHQKVVEESPSPAVTPEMRQRLGAAATALAREAGYVGAGTAEFLVSATDPGEFFFLEVNARLQVEHPVTELVTGLDLVELQLRIAAGEPLALTQDDVRLAGHAIEVRLCAEDPAADFLPATGPIVTLREPVGPGVRVDSGIVPGSVVTANYDSLLAKIIAFGADREEALGRLSRALRDLRVLGVTTNAGFLARLIAAPDVRAGEMDTKLIERGAVPVLPSAEQTREALVAAALTELLALHERVDSSDPWETLVGWRQDGRREVTAELRPLSGGDTVRVELDGIPAAVAVSIDGETVDASVARSADGRVRVCVAGHTAVFDEVRVGGRRWLAAGPDTYAFELVEAAVEGADAAGEGALESPMPGTVLAVNVAPGDTVREGDVLVVVESMKMELSLVAPADATVAEVRVSAGQGVSQGEALVELEAAV